MTMVLDIPDSNIRDTFLFIHDYWPSLTRDGQTLAFPLPGRFVIPGGFFKWFFYWDSYFTLLGLVVQGEWRLAREIVDNFILEIEHYGFVPNYNSPQGVCASRSQPPFLTSVLREIYPYIKDAKWLERAIKAALTEYEGYWLKEPHLTATGLSRYHDLAGSGCGTVPDTAHYRTLAESGWDNTPRFGDDATQITPVDLNSQLYRYELDLAQFFEILGQSQKAVEWRQRAETRRALIDRYLWDAGSGLYRDFDLRSGQFLKAVPRSLATFVPLWAGVASQQQAQHVRNHLSDFEYDYGLAACEAGWEDNTEHNFPTGWAYSHWYVTYGLRRYGFHTDAIRIAYKWLRLVALRFAQTGKLWERYNVVAPAENVPGRYRPLRGFGWTNGVFAALLVRIIMGLEYDPFTRQRLWQPQLPQEWRGQTVVLELSHYPWSQETGEKLAAD